HENIVEHSENPRNVGSLDKKDKFLGTVLYHLFNPDVPKFMTTCSVCFKEIHS
ncbi:unnamed protein product, partial [Ascophyllum nodosum]